MKETMTRLASPTRLGMQSFRNSWQRLSMTLLVMVMMMTAQTAWADNVDLTEDTGEAAGTVARWYVNMPASGANTLTLDGTVTAFKVYDDGGATGIYSYGCDGTLVLTAPDGYLLQLSGNITAETYDYLTVYNGNEASGTPLLDAVSSTGSGTKTDITTVISKGQSMTLFFHSDYSYNYDGLDLTVTLIDVSTQFSIYGLSNVTGGTVTASVGGTGATTAKMNDVVTLTATPGSGNLLNDLSVTDADGHPVSVDWSPWANTATFTMPISEVTVTPTFTNVNSLSVNIPKTGSKSITIPTGVESFKVYDDGGATGNYSDDCNGTLTLTAPANHVLQLSGNITAETCDNLTVYNGNEASGTPLLDRVTNTSSSTKTDITTVISKGQSMTLFFHSDYSYNYDGLDLTVTLIDVSTQFSIYGLSNVTGGTVTASVGGTGATTAKMNDVVTLTATPGSGYVLGNLIVTDANGHPVSVEWDNTTNTGTFTMPLLAVTVTPTFIPTSFVDNGDNTYTILDADGWNFFCDALEANDKGYFNGKTVKLGDDINITRMAGADNHDFTGTFDGQSHTLNVDLSDTQNQGTAPFRVISNATIRNLHVTGSVTGTAHAAGLVGKACAGTMLIENCLVETNVTSLVGDANGNKHCGGVVGHGFGNGSTTDNTVSLTLRNVVYAGTITCDKNYIGGLQGWSDGNTLTLENCLFAGSYAGKDGSTAAFHPIALHNTGKTTNLTATNVFAAVAPTATNANFIAADGTKTTGRATAPAGLGYQVATYNYMDMTAYENGLLYNGLYYVAPTLSTDTDNAYLINNEDDWTNFCDALYNNDTWNRFTGKTVKLANSISVTRMAGYDNHDFLGTFDGQHNKLTFTATATASYLAPFRNVLGNSTSDHAVIRDLNVVTNITAHDQRHTAGLIAEVWGYVDVVNCNVTANITATVGTQNPTDLYPSGLASQVVSGAQLTVSDCTVSGTIATDGKYAGGIIGIAQGSASITNCVSSVTINSSTEGDGTHGGLVAVQGNYEGKTLTIEGCVFNGKLLGASTIKCGGFVGWRSQTVNISNSLFAPAEVTVKNEGSATFARNATASCHEGCYYTKAFGAVSSESNAQGTQMYSITGDTGVTVANAGAVSNSYDVSELTFYTTGIKGGDVLYAASGETVSLELANTATGAPEGYQYGGYTASAGTLSGTTLTMPDENVTVSVNTENLDVLAPIDWATQSTGEDADHAYMIYNKDQLLLLAYRVNGTHGETADNFSGKFFKLGGNITFDYDPNEGNEYAENYEAIGCYDGDLRDFKGDFDGDNKIVSGIRIRKTGTDTADMFQGLFGYIGDGANIHDVHVTDACIKGYNSIGGIVGCNGGGTVNNCTVTESEITADNGYFGTICGWNRNGTLTNNYYHGCTVNGNAVTSGVGSNGNDITTDNGAMPVFTLSLADGVSTTTEPTITLDNTGYYALGKTVTLSYSGDVPAGYVFNGFTVYGETISSKPFTFTVSPDAQVGVAFALTPVSYIDADGKTQQCTDYTVLTGGGATTLEGGWYVVNSDINYTGTITLGGDVHLILADGAKMNIGTSSSRINGSGIESGWDPENSSLYPLTVYSQSLGDDMGQLNVYTSVIYSTYIKSYTQHGGNVTIDNNGYYGLYVDHGDITVNRGRLTANAESGAIESGNHSVTINGGQVTAGGKHGIAVGNENGTITLGWNRATDYIHASSYDGTVNIASGKAFTTDGTDIFSGSGVTGIDGKTLRPAVAVTLSEGITAVSGIISSGDDNYAKVGETVTVSVSVPDGQTFAGIAITPAIDVTDNHDDSYSFTVPTDDVSVSATLLAEGDVPYIDENGMVRARHAADNEFTVLDGSEETLGTADQETWYVANANLVYNSKLTLTGDVNLILTDGATMTVTDNTEGSSAIDGNEDNEGKYSLAIYGQSGQSGKLTATGGMFGIVGKNVYIHGGDVTAGGYGIIVSDNIVVSRGKSSGILGSPGDMTISGGEVNGIILSLSTINITGGNVTSEVSGTSYNAIEGKNVNITGGVVYVSLVYGYYKSAICAEQNITITGGQVTAIVDDDMYCQGIYADNGTITLGWTNPTDYIYATKYNGNVNIAQGQTLYDENGTPYSGDNVSNPYGKTLRPALPVQRGDANADGNVSVTDIAVVVNCILQLPNNGGFSEYGADANGDGQITVTDIGVIVDKILGTSGNAASRRMLQEVEPQ